MDFRFLRAVLVGLFGLDRISARRLLEVKSGVLTVRFFPTLWYGFSVSPLAETTTYPTQSRDARPASRCWAEYRPWIENETYLFIKNHQRIEKDEAMRWLDSIDALIWGSEFHGEIRMEFTFGSLAQLKIVVLDSSERVTDTTVIVEER